jgi:hypothetical protein
MAGEAMNIRGPCSSCGAALATDQRYCVECGQRVGPPLALPYAVPAATPVEAAATGSSFLGIALPVPMQMVTTFAAIALGFGVVVGTAISPNLAGIVAAPPPVVVAQAPPPPSTPPTPVTTGGGGGGGAAPTVTAPASTIPTSSPTGTSGGGGGGKQKKQKKQKTPATPPLSYSGTVVRVNSVAQSYTLATPALISIHADNGLPNVGDTLSVPVKQLTNNTYGEAGSRSATGTAGTASFSGTVTYCADLERPSAACNGSSATDHYVYSVSGVGSSVLVSMPVPAGGAPPAVGSLVDVTATIGGTFQPVTPAAWASDATCTPPYAEQTGLPSQPPGTPALTQTSANVTGQTQSSTVEAVVQTVCPNGSPKLVLSADDLRESGRDLAPLAVPSGIDLSKLTPGEAVQGDMTIAADGTLALAGITSDTGTAGASDASQGQGSLTGR